MSLTLRVALIINPIAGMGGPLALKGTDGMAETALAHGGEPKAGKRVAMALEDHQAMWGQIDWFAAPGPMGGDLLSSLNVKWQSMNTPIHEPTQPQDTQALAMEAVGLGVDLLLFAGGDGTARDICAVVEDRVPVLGIPAGVKIHSGVFAVTPHAAGEVLKKLAMAGLVDVRLQDVRDIDEEAFRSNVVRARLFGEMRVPDEGIFIQHTKNGGVEDEDLVIEDIADDIIESMEDDRVYIIGSGKTTARIMEKMALPNTLLGIDLVKNHRVVASDVTEVALFDLIRGASPQLIISVIGGQGHILGRGNQQLSPRVIQAIGREHIQVIATKGKLVRLDGRPLILDTGDRALDQALSGYWDVLTGYHDHVMYPVATF